MRLYHGTTRDLLQVTRNYVTGVATQNVGYAVHAARFLGRDCGEPIVLELPWGLLDVHRRGSIYDFTALRDHVIEYPEDLFDMLLFLRG